MGRAETLALSGCEDPIPAEARERYGEFMIWVYPDEDGVRAFYESNGLELPSEEEIHWHHEWHERSEPIGEEYWAVRKRYGRNVVLTWWTDEKRLDARWELLDAVLTHARALAADA